MTTLLLGPAFFTYQKVRQHRDGKRRIKNTARYEDLRREHEEEYFGRDEAEARLDQERMRTGFAMPEMQDDGHVRLSQDWEEERARRWQARQQELDYQSFRAASLRPAMTGNPTGNRPMSLHNHITGNLAPEYQPRYGSLDIDRSREPSLSRRSLQTDRTPFGHDSIESLGRQSPSYAKSHSELNRSHESLEPHKVEVPKQREEEPQDMSALFVDDILRERGLAGR